MDFTENNIESDTVYDGVFSKEIDFQKPELTTFTAKTEEVIKEIKDRISQARARTAKTKKAVNKLTDFFLVKPQAR